MRSPGTLGYAPVEDAVHINSYAQITAIAAAGGRGLCAVSTTPIVLHP